MTLNANFLYQGLCLAHARTVMLIGRINVALVVGY